MRRPIALLAGLALLAGCPGPAGPRTITHRRTASVPVKVAKLDATSADRFGGGPMVTAAAAAPRGLAWDTPAGWTARPDTSGMRLVSFVVSAIDSGAECSITVLAGGGGGVPANVARWRRQMGLPPVSIEEIEMLPQRPLLGGYATFIDLEGEYSGMGGEPRPGFELLALVRMLAAPGEEPLALFLKLVGPKAVVKEQERAFNALCASLRFVTDETPVAPAAPVAPPAARAPLRWVMPIGWADEGARPMHVATFTAGAATECTLSVLKGVGGGVEANLGRWCEQMGRPALAAPALAALPRLKVLGAEAPLLEVASGAPKNSLLLGVVCRRKDDTVFVKMVGPEPEVRAERERFLAFCASLEEGQP
jgi:hypothetical protein